MEVQTAGQDSRWAAVVARDAAPSEPFVYAVKTTGVYCRPGCPARTPKLGNVRFFQSEEEAKRAGFRPCQRCMVEKPDPADTIADVCRWMEQQETVPSLAQAAGRARLSPYHFHRLFKAITGITPHAYAMALRDERTRKRLQQQVRVTDAIYESGYNSTGRFYAHTDDALGMRPSEFRSGGAKNRIRFALGESSLGSILVAQSDRGICAISLGNDPDALLRELQDRFTGAELVGCDASFERIVAQVVAFVEAPRTGLRLPLDIQGSAFQKRVWQALQSIPPGKTATYTEIAQMLGRPAAVRAVGQACAANVLAVAIPCHRVVRTDGSLSGYRWGIERKRTLLSWESNK